jgi:photosystem II stability/assembly factor-like uncharacterized protein
MAELIFAGTRRGLGVLERRNGSFREARRAFADTPITAVAADAATRRVFVGTTAGVFRSADAGQTWSAVDPLAGKEARYIHVDRDDHRVYVGTHPDVEIHVSADGGERWDALRFQEKIPAAVREMWCFHPFPRYGPHVKSIASAGGRLYVNIEEGWCYRSDDGGTSWQPLLHNGLNADAHVLAVHPRDRDVVYSTDAFGACRSRDGGQRWTRISTGDEEGPRRYGGGIAVHPRDPSIVLFSVGLARVFTLAVKGAQSSIFRTADAGETWERVRDGLDDPMPARIETLVFDGAAEPCVYALTDLGELLEGRDGGRAWRRVAADLGGHSGHYALGVM